MNATPPPRHHLIITGTGRTGTTFLVRLLTELGLDTGYTRRTWRRDYSSFCDAGLEHHLSSGAGAPYVVKTPDLCDSLPALLAAGGIVVDHAIVPVRNLDEAARSRLRIGGAHGTIPGGLLKTDDPAQQKAILAEMFHQLVHTLVAHDIPHTFLLFPRLVLDADYAYDRLSPLLPGVSRPRFRRVFASLADPAKVHRFDGSAPVTPDPGIPALLAASERRRRSRRRARHTLGWLAAATALALIAFQLVHSRRAQTPPVAAAAVGETSHPTAGP